MALAAVVLSAVLYGLLFPPFGLWWLSWLALSPLALALRGARLRTAVAWGALWGWLATTLIVAWLVPTLHQHFEQSLGWSVAFWLLFGTTALCPYYAVLLGGYAWASSRASPLLRSVLFAATWAACEYTRSQIGFRSPWTKLGDAHAASAHLRQLADLGGVYAVSALVAFGNGVVAEGLHALWRRARKQAVAWKPLLAATSGFVVVVALGLCYGAWRMHQPMSSGSELRVALVQGNLPPELRWRRTTAARVVHRYGGLTRDLLVERDGATLDLIVWPENAIQTGLHDPVYGAAVRRMVRAGVPLLIGAPRSEARADRVHHFNSALLLRTDGLVQHYDKRRLLPFSETQPLGGWLSFGPRGDLDSGSYTAGDSAALFELPGARVAPLICMEALYPELAREAARGGATLLANLSNDGWYRGWGGAEQHLAQVVFRAVETRLPLVRATTTGISAIVTPDGEVRARLEEGESGVLRASVPTPLGSPPAYVRLGDAFAVSCLVAWAVAVLRAWRPLRAQASSETDRGSVQRSWRTIA